MGRGPTERSLVAGGMRCVVQRFARAVALIGRAAAPAHAQSVAEANSVTVTPFVGVTFGGIGRISAAALASAGRSATTGRRTSASNSSSAVCSTSPGKTTILDIPLTTISGNFVYHFDVVHVTPYATVGLGWERCGINLDDVDEDPDGETEIAWNFGGGVKIPINSRVLAPRRPAPLPGQRPRARPLEALRRRHLLDQEVRPRLNAEG